MGAAAIPFEMQSDPQTNRACGAACLSMVYRSFGKEVPQAKIWPAIAKENRLGSLASTTHLMAQDASSRGFRALAVQARHPLQALKLCRESGIRAILNHRLNRSVPTGHFTVLVDIDGKDVFLHDPFLGPSRRLSHAELLELWQPRFPNSEIVGNVLIGIADQPTLANSCWLCQSTIPATVECPNCKKPVALQPNTVLGCMNTDCVTRIWEYICCPFCDFTWTFSLQAGQSGMHPFPLDPSITSTSNSGSTDAQGPSTAEHSPWMKPLFNEINKFCDHIRGIPGAAGHPDIKKQLDMIGINMERLVLAQAEMLTYQKMAQAQIAEMQEASRLKKEIHRKKMEELNRPAPPLDGNALGHALLKNLGFKD